MRNFINFVVTHVDKGYPQKPGTLVHEQLMIPQCNVEQQLALSYTIFGLPLENIVAKHSMLWKWKMKLETSA